MKPFLKWAGGKSKLLPYILPEIPTKIVDYHEPFVGGGSVLLAVLSDRRIRITGTVYAYDSNPHLIELYINIRDNKDELYGYIIKFIEIYNTDEEGYYKMRDLFNTKAPSVQSSALFLILNKLCFRGLYREGPRGFNVPFGHYKNPTIITKAHINEVSSLILNVVFRCMDFRKSLAPDAGSFVYLDPPYAPESPTSFVKYTKDGFGIDDHEALFSLVENLPSFIMSNSNVPLVTERFTTPLFNKKILNTRRAINAKNPGAVTTEVIIYRLQ